MDILQIPLWAWAATIAALAALLSADLIRSARRTSPVRMREAALWTLATITLAMLFGAVLALTVGGAAAGQFYAGWLTEYSLSLDNLVVFLLLISTSGVPRQFHGRVLLLGILLALVLRGVFIGVGAVALQRFGWVEYLFGAFLLYAAPRMSLHRSAAPAQVRENGAIRAARRVLPVSEHGDGARLTTRAGGRWQVTPMLILIIAIGATDVMFALDSIPAIFGLTRDPFLVFTANLFALLGLRHLYFLAGALLGRLAHLTAGLAAILAFIGVKLIAQALAETGVTRLGPIPVPEVSTGVSLAVIAGVMAVVTLTSLASSRRRARRSGRRPRGAGRAALADGDPPQGDPPQGDPPQGDPPRADLPAGDPARHRAGRAGQWPARPGQPGQDA